MLARTPTLALEAGQSMRVRARWYASPDGKVSDFDGAIPIDPDTWVRVSDLAPGAVRARGSASTGLAFDIDVQGRIVDCTILESSGAVEVDRHWCDVLAHRAAFVPAIDAAGMPRIAHGRTSVRWDSRR